MCTQGERINGDLRVLERLLVALELQREREELMKRSWSAELTNNYCTKCSCLPARETEFLKYKYLQNAFELNDVQCGMSLVNIDQLDLTYWFVSDLLDGSNCLHNCWLEKYTQKSNETLDQLFLMKPSSSQFTFISTKDLVPSISKLGMIEITFA